MGGPPLYCRKVRRTKPAHRTKNGGDTSALGPLSVRRSGNMRRRQRAIPLLCSIPYSAARHAPPHLCVILHRLRAIFWPKVRNVSAVTTSCLATTCPLPVQSHPVFPSQGRMASLSHRPTCPALAPARPEAARSVGVHVSQVVAVIAVATLPPWAGAGHLGFPGRRPSPLLTPRPEKPSPIRSTTERRRTYPGVALAVTNTAPAGRIGQGAQEEVRSRHLARSTVQAVQDGHRGQGAVKGCRHPASAPRARVRRRSW
jgi:hypothetical protein